MVGGLYRKICGEQVETGSGLAADAKSPVKRLVELNQVQGATESNSAEASWLRSWALSTERGREGNAKRKVRIADGHKVVKGALATGGLGDWG